MQGLVIYLIVSGFLVAILAVTFDPRRSSLQGKPGGPFDVLLALVLYLLAPAMFALALFSTIRDRIMRGPHA